MPGKHNIKKVIQLELNEISPYLIRKLVNQGKLPNFKKVISEWQQVDTTSEDIYEHIEPWIQWVTVHTGKTYTEHGIFRLGDAHDLKHPQIWECLQESSVKSAIIGAMNAIPGNFKDGIFFPDPWSKSNTTMPGSLKGLWKVISSKVQSHSTSQPSVRDFIDTLSAVKEFKLSPFLLARIAKQIINQKIDPKCKWRLVGLFDLFLGELFINVLKKNEHRYLTLFLNSVAHYQHHFWRNLEPEKFDQNVKAPDCNPEDNPLLYGYEVLDEVLGKTFKEINFDDTLVLIVSGLSQIPDTRSEQVGGMNYYRLIDHKAFASRLNVPSDNVFPLMSRDWQVRLEENKKEDFIRGIEAFRVDSHPLFTVSKNADGYVFIETAVTQKIAADAMIYFGDQTIGRFHDNFVNIAVKSGHHTGVGVLWSSKNLSNFGFSNSMPLTKIFDLTRQVFQS
ncbi:MAG: alkaline phosphatase family protein [Proteobacteria bacterium]|nr:alkaline phosphatase family protein [Pseudomonadota bacterium]